MLSLGTGGQSCVTKGGGDAEDGGGTKAGVIQSRMRLLSLVALQLISGVPCGIQLSFYCVCPLWLMHGIGKMRGPLVVGTFLEIDLMASRNQVGVLPMCGGVLRRDGGALAIYWVLDFRK